MTKQKSDHIPLEDTLSSVDSAAVVRDSLLRASDTELYAFAKTETAAMLADPQANIWGLRQGNRVVCQLFFSALQALNPDQEKDIKIVATQFRNSLFRGFPNFSRDKKDAYTSYEDLFPPLPNVPSGTPLKGIITTAEQDLLNACRATPDDHLPHFMYVDELLKDGDPEKQKKAEYILLIAQARDLGCIVPFPDTLSIPFADQRKWLSKPLQNFVENPEDPATFDAVSLALTSLIELKPLGDLTTLEGQKQQYDFQLLTNQSLRYLTKNTKTGSVGIEGIDNKFYPFPTFEKIQKYLSTHKDIQPDDQLIIEPFALPLDTKFDRASAWMTRHKNLFPQRKLDEEPIHRGRLYTSADTNGTLLYNPVRFTSNHEGKTKAAILADPQLNSPFPGYRVRIVPASSRQSSPEHLGVSLNTILDTLSTSQRQTPDEYLHLFISHAIATKSVLDADTFTRLPGACLVDSDRSCRGVSYARWDTENLRLYFGWYDLGGAVWYAGFRWSREEMEDGA